MREKGPLSKLRRHSGDLLRHLTSGAGRKEKLLSGLGCLSAPLETLDPEWDPLIPALHARPPGPGHLWRCPLCATHPPVAFRSQTLPGVVWAGFAEGIVLLMKQSGHYTGPGRPRWGRGQSRLWGQPGTQRVTAVCCGLWGLPQCPAFVRANPSGFRGKTPKVWGVSPKIGNFLGVVSFLNKR